MKRNIEAIKYELIHQILFCELCFNICNSVKIIPGRGNDFLPYYYNLNFTKGLLSLHSLLLSREKKELSIKNYINEYKKNYNENITKFEKSINSISTSFEKSFPAPLRHKIAGHIDENFRHTDFTSAYIIPTIIPRYIEIIVELKDTFFKFCNYAKNDNPFQKIKRQSDKILKNIE